MRSTPTFARAARRPNGLGSIVLASVLTAGCGSATATADDAGTATDASSAVDLAQASGGDSTDPTKLPVGDKKYAASARVGYVFSCQQSFNGMGASKDGAWIKGDGTYDSTAKIVVQGSVAWPTHMFNATVAAGTRTLSGNGLPSHNTGTYPIAAGDPAHAYDANPNSIKAQTLLLTLPATPTVAAQPTCLDGGSIGVLLTGSAFFDALDALGRDAGAHETQDACEGHPEMSGEYHYHTLSSCISDPGNEHSALVGYARDGFGIYGVRGEGGKVLSNADLDECHGHTHSITWDGQTVSMYHYHATYEFPYTLGCFKGTKH